MLKLGSCFPPLTKFLASRLIVPRLIERDDAISYEGALKMDLA